MSKKFKIFFMFLFVFTFLSLYNSVKANTINKISMDIFVDSNGNIVGDTYSGAKSAKEWKQVIEKELEKIKNK